MASLPASQKDLVSIITPVFNSERFIEETIASVQGQTYGDWELLVLIDAGTTDRTAEIVQRFAAADERVRLIEVPGGRNVSDARNYGFQRARGRFVAFLDADDLWLPTKLEKQIKFMKETGAALSFTGFRRMSMDARSVGREIHIPRRLTYSALLRHNPIGCLTVMVDVNKTGSLRMGNDIHEDYCLWLRIVRAGGEAFGLTEDLARYRVVKGSRSSDKFKMASWRWRVYRDTEKLSFIRSAYYFAWYSVRTLSKHLVF
jgi:teichuronic acid biosynthesis glycosyltransferase TuaG